MLRNYSFSLGNSFESQCQKTFIWACEPSQDSDQPVHLLSDKNRHWTQIGETRKQRLSSDYSDEKADLSVLRVFVGHICQKVRFLTLWSFIFFEIERKHELLFCIVKSNSEVI